MAACLQANDRQIIVLYAKICNKEHSNRKSFYLLERKRPGARRRCHRERAGGPPIPPQPLAAALRRNAP